MDTMLGLMTNTIVLRGVWYADAITPSKGEIQLVERDDGSVRPVDAKSGFVFEGEDKLYLAADGCLRGFGSCGFDGNFRFDRCPPLRQG